MNVSDKELDFFIKHNMNVLFRGKHGVGKTSIIKDAFARNDVKFRYFSASTMDPWVDFIGIPKEKEEEGQTFLELVRPKEFALDQVEALFFDEFNRAPDKVRNAVMELIQFRSINGKKFKNLRMVWAAINPKDEEGKYDVHELDPAQEDRFVVHIDLAYAPDKKYFVTKYGGRVAEGAIKWWNSLPQDTKDLVSPRRLDEAINFYQIGGKMSHILPAKTNVSKLVQAIASEDSKSKIIKLIKENGLAEIETMLQDDNIYSELEEWLYTDKTHSKTLIPLIPNEKLSKVLSETTEKKIQEAICSLVYSNDKITNVVRSVREVTKSPDLISAMNQYVPALSSEMTGKNPIPEKAMTEKSLELDEIIKLIGDWNANNSACVSTIERQKIIDTMTRVPSTINETIAVQLFYVLAVCIIRSHEKTVRDNLNKIFPSLNMFLRLSKTDLRTSNEGKFVLNKLIQFNLQEYIWVPEGK